MEFVVIGAERPLSREDENYTVELPVLGEIQNYTYVSAATLQNDFPGVTHTGVDRELGRSLAALLSFVPTPDEPTSGDIVTSLRLIRASRPAESDHADSSEPMVRIGG